LGVQPFQDFVETIREAIFAGELSGTTLVNRLTYVSPQIEAITGRPPAAFLEDAHLWSRLLHPEDAPRVDAETAAGSALGKPMHREYRLWNDQAGEWRWIEDTVVVRVNSAGTRTAFVGSARDVTERKRAEEAQRRNERHYRALAEAAQDYIFVLDPEGRALYVNQMTAALLDRKPDALIGTKIDDVLPSDRAPLVRQRITQVVATGQPMYVEDRLPILGAQRWFGTWLAPIIDDGAAVEAVLCVSRDITARRESEDALRDSEARMAAALEATGDGLWDWNLETGEVRTDASWLARAGFEPAAFEAAGSLLGLVHPEDLPRLGCAYVLCQDQAQPTFECEFRLRQATGDYRWHLLRGKVVAMDADGRPLRAIGITSDIARRKEAAEERARLIRAVEQVNEAIVITALDGTIEYVNPSFERVTGYRAAEVSGRNPRLLKSGVHEAAFYERMWKTLARGEVWRGTLVNRRKDGGFYEEEATISPVRNDIGQVISYVAVKRDATEERQLQEQFQQAQKLEAVGRLAGGVAHDFNNTLAVILGYTETILLSVDAGDPLRQDLDEIMRAAQRAARLTRQLLAYSRRQILQPRAVNLNDLIDDCERMLRRLVREDVRIVIRADPDLGLVKVDPGQIDQVLMNLVVNSRDAMADGGTITIETANIAIDEVYVAQHPSVVPGPYVQLQVSDTGTGIAPDALAHIFEPFYTTKPKGQGTGLGLATVHGIVHQSGGHIRVSSEPARGTTFTICFPQCPRASALAVDGPHLGEPSLTGTETVLLVEDDGGLRELGRILLRGFGYTVLAAGHGAEALEIAGRHQGRIDLLLTDVIMPGMSGRTLADLLSEQRADLRTLYMSGYADDAIVRHGVLEAGMRFLPKPFTRESLGRAVRDALDLRSDAITQPA
jgi:PAS domain S-box-containing protein